MAIDFGSIVSNGTNPNPTANPVSGYMKDQKNAKLIASFDPGARPGEPGSMQDFQSLIDPNTGMLFSQYQVGDEYDQPVNDVLAKYREQALLPEDQQSSWAKVMTQQLQGQKDLLATNQQHGLEDTVRQGATQAAQARSAIAARTGISNAVLNRANISSSRDLGNQLQSQRASNLTDTTNLNLKGLDITAQDLQNRQNMLGQLGNLEMTNRNTLTGREQFNIGNTLTENENKRNYDMQKYAADIQKYQADMSGWAAGKQAQATAASGGGGGKK